MAKPQARRTADMVPGNYERGKLKKPKRNTPAHLQRKPANLMGICEVQDPDTDRWVSLPLSVADELDAGKRVCGFRRRGKDKNGKRVEGICLNPPGRGTDHFGVGWCATHGGNSEMGRKEAARIEMMIMTRHVLAHGETSDVDPHDAMVRCLRIASGELSYCNMRISLLADDELAINSKTEELRDEIDRFGDVHEGLSKTTETNQADLNVWLKARSAATDRLARYSKMAIDMGVAERQVAIAERYGESIARVLDSFMEEMEFTPKQIESAPAAVQKALQVIDSTAVEIK